jgi:hypothetical protein
MKFRIDDAYAASAGSNAPWLQQVHSLDDGTLRPWSSSPEASRTWDDAGDYLLRVQARCVDHPEYESYWSYSLIIFAVGETILPATRFPFFIFELLLE